VKKGFTLIELLLVVTILGILAAIAVPKFFPHTERARIAETISILQSIRQGEEAYFLEKGEYLFPISTVDNVSWAKLGMDNPNPARYFTYQVETDRGDVDTYRGLARRQNDSSGQYNGSTIRLSQDGLYSCSTKYASMCPT